MKNLLDTINNYSNNNGSSFFARFGFPMPSMFSTPPIKGDGALPINENSYSKNREKHGGSDKSNKSNDPSTNPDSNKIEINLNTTTSDGSVPNTNGTGSNARNNPNTGGINKARKARNINYDRNCITYNNFKIWKISIYSYIVLEIYNI